MLSYIQAGLGFVGEACALAYVAQPALYQDTEEPALPTSSRDLLAKRQT